MPLISYRYNNPSRSYTPTETASYYVIIPLLIQQASLRSYDTPDTPTNYSTIPVWYSNIYVITLDRLTNLYVMTLIQQPSILLSNNRLSKLPYGLMILLIKNLIHYYTTMDLILWYDTLLQQPTIPLYMTWYNNLYIRYDTDTVT